MNTSLTSRSVKTSLAVVSLILCLMLIGCQKGAHFFESSNNESGSITPEIPVEQVEASNPHDVNRVDIPFPTPEYDDVHSIEPKFPEGVTSSGHETDQAKHPNEQIDHKDQQDSSPESGQHDEPNKEVNNSEPMAESKPALPSNASLMNIRIGDTLTQVKKLHGEASQQYEMASDNNPIMVYVYHGFEVGFDSSQKAEFIDVTSSQVDPGLNGVRVQQTVEDAVAVLGPPDVNTQFVLNYYYEDVVLKMDIDPRNHTISSIKLFPVK